MKAELIDPEKAWAALRTAVDDATHARMHESDKDVRQKAWLLLHAAARYVQASQDPDVERLRMWDEWLEIGMFAGVQLHFAVSNPGASIEHCGVGVRFDDGSSKLTHAFEPTIRECLMKLADRWGEMVKKIIARAEEEPLFDHSRRKSKYRDKDMGYCVCDHCAKLPDYDSELDEFLSGGSDDLSEETP